MVRERRDRRHSPKQELPLWRGIHLFTGLEYPGLSRGELHLEQQTGHGDGDGRATGHLDRYWSLHRDDSELDGADTGSRRAVADRPRPELRPGPWPDDGGLVECGFAWRLPEPFHRTKEPLWRDWGFRLERPEREWNSGDWRAGNQRGDGSADVSRWTHDHHGYGPGAGELHVLARDPAHRFQRLLPIWGIVRGQLYGDR